MNEYEYDDILIEYNHEIQVNNKQILVWLVSRDYKNLRCLNNYSQNLGEASMVAIKEFSLAFKNL